MQNYYNIKKNIVETDGKNILRAVGAGETKEVLVKDIVIQCLRAPDKDDNEDIKYAKFLLIARLVNCDGPTLSLEYPEIENIKTSVKKHVIDPWIMGQCIEVFE